MEPWPVADRVWLNRIKGPPAPFVMSTVRHEHRNRVRTPGLVAAPLSPPSSACPERPGVSGYIMNTEGPPWDQDAGIRPARRPHVIGSAGAYHRWRASTTAGLC